MKRIETWYVYYGDDFWDTKFEKTFTTMKKEWKKTHPNWTNKEIYLDYLHNKHFCKIGITRNLSQRERSLYYSEGTIVHKYIEFKGTYAQALKIESDLRFAIEQAYPSNAIHRGNDHFYCITIPTLKYIYNRFDEWVNESIKITKVERV